MSDTTPHFPAAIVPAAPSLMIWLSIHQTALLLKMAKFKQVKTIYPSARPLQERKSSMLPNAARRGISVDGITPISEGKVLKPIDKTKQTDSDTWPCYVLEDTIVYKNGDKSQLCSVLHTELDGPLTIEGKLDPTSLDKKIAKNRTLLHFPIRTFLITLSYASS